MVVAIKFVVFLALFYLSLFLVFLLPTSPVGEKSDPAPPADPKPILYGVGTEPIPLDELTPKNSWRMRKSPPPPPPVFGQWNESPFGRGGEKQ
jgi:hypothetical protein